jgi:uncharacterized protein YdiU (UPF0061 family)
MAKIKQGDFMATIKFDNKFIDAFEFDNGPSQIPRLTPGFIGALVLPTPISSPKLLALSPEVATLVGLKYDKNELADLAEVFSGAKLLEGSEPYATRYGGHQFGSWADQLGDGRAISLGEAIGDFGKSWEIQLKGAGLTPYSRRGDGRAVLRSSIREYICSEAMFALGVPTTRALSCVLTGDLVTRDMFYDGHPKQELGAITTRVAPTFIRFGHFEILAAHGEAELLTRLIKFTASNYFDGFKINSPQDLGLWFTEICKRTCDLVVHWQRVGFVHGVLNTDNMSILGVTIDYGPFGFLDDYNTNWTPNTTDAQNKRYRYSNQPEIVYWNLQRLAEALSFTQFTEAELSGISRGEVQKQLIEIFNEGLAAFGERFEDQFPKMMAAKIGIGDFTPETDMEILMGLDHCLSIVDTDFTIFYRSLSQYVANGDLDLGWIGFFNEVLVPSVYSELSEPDAIADWKSWFAKFEARVLNSD